MLQTTELDKKIPERLDLSDRINVTARREAVVTLKDHKKISGTNYQPLQTLMGKVSKEIVKNISLTA